jgi:hypothetical protein
MHYPKVNRLPVSFPKLPVLRARKRNLKLLALLLLPLAAAAATVAIVASPVSATSGLERSVSLPVAAPKTAALAVALPTLALPVEAPVAAPIAEPEPVAVTAPSWSIGISAFGWQDELDACQWVLMDMVAEVPLPIVAAHNYCGGGIVLEMQVGDTVTLSGYGFDGTYVVTGDRDAWSGGDAATAISGMGGDVILQTCYWDDDGTERLVSLQRTS